MLAVALVVLAVPLGTAARVWYVGQQDARPRSDAIIVLGAAQYNGRPSAVFAARLAHAAELYRAGVAPRIITVGSSLQGDNFTEAGSGGRWLVARGDVPQRRIIPVPRGHDTLGSLRGAREVLRRHDWSSALVVTDPWHSLRARAMARDLGMRAATSPARENNPLVGPTRVEAEYITRETFAYLYYALFRKSTELEVPV